MERHSDRSGGFTAQDEKAAVRPAPPRGGQEATSNLAEQLDTIQQRLFALGLALGLAGSNSTDGTTATELRRLEGLVAELIVDIRAWTRPLMHTGPEGVRAADGDLQGRHDVIRRAERDATHGRDRR